MPRIVRNSPATSTSSSQAVGSLVPEDRSVTAGQARDHAAKVDLFYMCRAYSEENRPGFHHNEDRFFCEEHLSKNNAAEKEAIDMFIVGVMDGHDGGLAAELVGEQLPPVLFHACIAEEKLVHDAHVRGFEEVEESMKKAGSTAGCCANSCVVWGRYLWCSNLGDCRAVYIPLNGHDKPTFEVGAFKWMSRDLKAAMPYEQERLRALGYTVTADHRVEGLEPTRTIGDLDVKSKLPDGVISIIPETRCVDLLGPGMAPGEGSTGTSGSAGGGGTGSGSGTSSTSGGSSGSGSGGSSSSSPVIAELAGTRGETDIGQGILVQGTDGIWDMIKGQDILNFLRVRSKQIRMLQKYMATSPQGGYDPENAIAGVLERIAQDIVTYAMTKGSSDDCTAIVTCVSVRKKK